MHACGERRLIRHPCIGLGTETEAPIGTEGGATVVIKGAISAKIACNGPLQASVGSGYGLPMQC